MVFISKRGSIHWRGKQTDFALSNSADSQRIGDKKRREASIDPSALCTGRQHFRVLTRRKSKLRPLFCQPGYPHVYTDIEGYPNHRTPTSDDWWRWCQGHPIILWNHHETSRETGDIERILSGRIFRSVRSAFRGTRWSGGRLYYLCGPHGWYPE